jgi:sulfide:quinone oxidoreductase
MFTLVGGGLRSLQDATQPEVLVLPQNIDWLHTAVADIDPDNSSVTTADGRRLRYEYLVVATGEWTLWVKQDVSLNTLIRWSQTSKTFKRLVTPSVALPVR